MVVNEVVCKVVNEVVNEVVNKVVNEVMVNHESSSDKRRRRYG